MAVLCRLLATVCTFPLPPSLRSSLEGQLMRYRRVTRRRCGSRQRLLSCGRMIRCRFGRSRPMGRRSRMTLDKHRLVNFISLSFSHVNLQVSLPSSRYSSFRKVLRYVLSLAGVANEYLSFYVNSSPWYPSCSFKKSPTPLQVFHLPFLPYLKSRTASPAGI